MLNQLIKPPTEANVFTLSSKASVDLISKPTEASGALCDIKAFSISQINQMAKNALEGEFSNIFIEGEVSKMSAANSYKHWYFTLKDENSSITCAYFNPPANLTQPQIGAKIIIGGKLSIYVKDARFQFIANRLYFTDSKGAMHEEYLRLYQKLKAAGIFDKKQAIKPSFKSVGIITSASSAAMADILRIKALLKDDLTKVSIYDSLVQGNAAKELINALNQADKAGHDVILISRGGGSKEDLFCFNDEALIMAIYNAKTPIITAIGHEIDQHLADFAADLSLPTPSAAARRIFIDYEARVQELDILQSKVQTAITTALETERNKLKIYTLSLLKNPFKEYLSKLQAYSTLLLQSARSSLKFKEQKLQSYMLKQQIEKSLANKRLILSKVEPAKLKAKTAFCAKELEFLKERINKARTSQLVLKRQQLSKYHSLISAHEGFLKTIRKNFTIKQNDAYISDLNQLKIGDEICIQNALNPQNSRKAKITE